MASVQDQFFFLGHFQVGSYLFGALLGVYIPHGSLIEALNTLNSPPAVFLYFLAGPRRGARHSCSGGCEFGDAFRDVAPKGSMYLLVAT